MYCSGRKNFSFGQITTCVKDIHASGLKYLPKEGISCKILYKKNNTDTLT
jgi:hypothetical protein